MRLLRVVFALVFIMSFGLDISAEIKQKTFTKEEIKKMTETKAVIETKNKTVLPTPAPANATNAASHG